MKIFILLVVLGLAGGWCAGYRAYPQNISYYVTFDAKRAVSEVRLRNGSVISGVIEEETEDTLKLNVDGAKTVFSRAEIVSVKTEEAPDLFSMLRRNYDRHHERHPLVTRRKEDSLTARIDNALSEPGRIAEQIKKDNPDFSASARLDKAMAEAARMRQAANQRREQIEKDLAG